MVEQEFMRLLREYPDSLDARKRFIGLVNDFLYMQPLQANLVLTLYKMDIHKDIEKAVRLDNTFAYRFIKRLTDEHGVSRENAVKSVFIWCLCYGEKILGRPCEMDNTYEAFEMQNDEVLSFTDKLRNENYFDTKMFNEILSAIPKNGYNTFLSAVSKSGYEKSDTIYYGLIAAQMNNKFNKSLMKTGE
ncbi:MAG: hypothetical protein FWF94_07805 [Oscillospiraceae bacterium]|nr:hypothetical protein [Oscillospiraceae bacterium]